MYSQPPRCSKPPNYCFWSVTWLISCLCICVRRGWSPAPLLHVTPHPSFLRFFVCRWLCRFLKGYRHNLPDIFHISTPLRWPARIPLFIMHFYACVNINRCFVLFVFFYTEQQFVQGLDLSTCWSKACLLVLLLLSCNKGSSHIEKWNVWPDNEVISWTS